MMLGNYVNLGLLVLASVLVLVLFLFTLRIRNKNQIHYAFLVLIVLLFIWVFFNELEILLRIILGKTLMPLVYTYLVGLCLLPVALLYTGKIFSKTKIRFSFLDVIILAVPVLDTIVVVTNDMHGLYLEKYSPFNYDIAYGPFLAYHSVIAYVYLLFGIYYLIRFSVKNSGIFSKQSILIIIGSAVPIVVNILYTLKIFTMQAASTPVAFSVTVLCFAYAIFKYEFLNVVPIALQTVVDSISDAFVVLNEQMRIIDYNQPFTRLFGKLYKFRRMDNFIDAMRTYPIMDLAIDDVATNINKTRDEKKPASFERRLTDGIFNRHFTIEITPLFSNARFIGTLVLLKDITDHKNNLQALKDSQEIIMEQERLASLGQLIGGIAHNLRTPIMSISGGIEALKDLVDEYDSSVEDKEVTPADHHEIAEEMRVWLSKIKPHCSYMSDIISTVKGQAVQMSSTVSNSFTVGELVKSIEILMKHELKKFQCSMNTKLDIDELTEIKGELNSLVQIFDNIIINAIDSYDGKSGNIDFGISKDGENIHFTIKDYGKGMPDNIKDRVFKEMITTKGKNGTGLGLYMSHSTIKGRFGGTMWFSSKLGEGTEFHILIPTVNVLERGGNQDEA